MAIDYTTALGQLRLLIADVDEANLVLTDPMVEGYLAMHGLTKDAANPPLADVKRAAADALDAIATSEVLVSKVIRSQDLQTDGAKVAAELRAQAANLRAQADTADEDTAWDGDSGFGVSEFRPYPTGAHEAAEVRW